MRVGGHCHSLAFLPLGETFYPLNRRLVWPQGQCGCVQKSHPPVAFDPQTIQSVASHYMDNAILAYFQCRLRVKQFFNMYSPQWMDMFIQWRQTVVHSMLLYRYSLLLWDFVHRVTDICVYIYIYINTRCPRRNGQNFGRVFLMLKYTDITQNTHIQSWAVTEIMAREVWNFDSCYTLTDYQIHIKTGRNMWFL